MYFLRTRFSRLHRVLLLLTALGCIGYIHAAVASDNAGITTTRIKYQVQVKDNIESVKQMLISALEAKNYMIISVLNVSCLLYTSPSPRDGLLSRMPSSA